MIDTLYNYFESIIGTNASKNGDILQVNLSSNYGCIDLTCNFKKNEFIVEGSVDEDQFCNIYMCDTDQIDEDDLDGWNTTDTYNNVIEALQRCQEILDALEDETGGPDMFDLENPDFFTDAIKLIDGE